MEVPVICRLSRSLLITGTGFSLLALLVLWIGLSSPETTTLEALAVTSLFGIPAFLIILGYYRCRITTNENGLEIRHMFKTEFIGWHQISDFYFRLPSSSKQSRKPDIFIEYGTRQHLISHDLENLPALLEAIEQKATRANAQKFDFKELRSVLDTPQVFEYANHQIWPLVLTALISWLVFIGVLFVPIIAEKGWRNYYDSTFGVLPLPLSWLLVVMTLAFTGIVPAIFLSCIPAIKTVRKFHGQQITASQAGIEWRNGDNTTAIPWSEIRSYHHEKTKDVFLYPLRVVESEHERICFLGTISRVNFLQLLISQNAVNAEVESWAYKPGHDEETLGTITISDGDTKQIFHYKTRFNRALLFGTTIVCLIMFPIIYLLNQMGGELDAYPFFVIVPLLIVSLYGLLSYYLTRVEITPEGVRHITAFRKSFLGWNEIKALKIPDPQCFYTIVGEGKTIRIATALAEPKQFKLIMEQRSGKNWEARDEQEKLALGQ